jgi:hypothetical protein
MCGRRTHLAVQRRGRAWQHPGVRPPGQGRVRGLGRVCRNTALINAPRDGGDFLNVFSDFPTLAGPRHADASSPLPDAQLGLWGPKAVREGLNTRQIDENVVLSLAAQHPDLLTGSTGHRPGLVPQGGD